MSVELIPNPESNPEPEKLICFECPKESKFKLHTVHFCSNKHLRAFEKRNSIQSPKLSSDSRVLYTFSSICTSKEMSDKELRNLSKAILKHSKKSPKDKYNFLKGGEEFIPKEWR